MEKEEVKRIPKKEDSDPGKVFKTLLSYSFYESGKMSVKAIITIFPGIKDHPRDKIKVDFKPRSLSVKIYDFKGSNYKFAVPRLQCRIQHKKCSYSIRDKTINITLRKMKENDHWYSLFRSLAVGERYSDDSDDSEQPVAKIKEEDKKEEAKDSKQTAKTEEPEETAKIEETAKTEETEGIASPPKENDSKSADPEQQNENDGNQDDLNQDELSDKEDYTGAKIEEID